MPISAIAFDSIPVAGLLLRLDGTLVAANPAARRSLGGGSTLAELLPGLPERWDGLVAAARADGHAVGEVTLDRRHLEVQLAVFDHGAEPLVQLYTVDVTTLRARLDEGHQLAAQQRLDSLGLVAGGIAHDFNNLLVGVLAEASAAREEPALAEGTREALRRIEAAARRMAHLTRQLLAYSGRGQVATVPVAVDELVGELREQLAQLAPAGVALEVTPGAAGAVVEADAAQLRQVVLNLAANAAEAGGDRISISTSLVSRDGVPYWQLEVADRGAGMDASTIARIFEPFFTTKPGQPGLGLSAVHGIVRRLSGDVHVESKRGGGSRFRVQLPVSPGAAPRRATSDAAISVSRLTGLRVLVADDEPSVRATVRRLLERRGATVVVAADGLEAEARLREEQFQLVVSDVSMPGVGGYEVLSTARATQACPVVLMSGYTEKLRGQGDDEPDAFLEKPFTAKTLDALIDDVLEG